MFQCFVTIACPPQALHLIFFPEQLAQKDWGESMKKQSEEPVGRLCYPVVICVNRNILKRNVAKK